jgi:hypothetical protein
MASMILSWCFDVLTKILISHLLICHQLPTTPRWPPTPSDHRIPSNTSSMRDKRNIEVRNSRQVYLPDTFDWLTSHPSFSCFLPGGILLHAPRPQNIPPDPPIPSNTSTTRGKRNMEAICWGEVSRQGKSWSEELLSSFFASWHLTSAWWLLRLCKQTTHNNQPLEMQNNNNQNNKHTTINPRPAFLGGTAVSCCYLSCCALCCLVQH